VESDRLVGLYSYSDVRTLVEKVEPMYNRDERYRLRAGAAIGPGDHERVEILSEEEVDAVVIDTAHGHTRSVIDMVKWVKKSYPNIDVVAGNIGTGEAAVALRDAGADAVKVGIGPGSICTTRVVCGVGIPQFTAVYQCAKALEGSIPVIADGGIRHSGDVPKALVAGADCVMMGSALAGTEESPGEKIIQEGRQYVLYRGMGSLAAMREARGSRERYLQHNAAEDDLVPQGVEGLVPYAGSVRTVINQYCGGLTSALGYSGCPSVGELREGGRVVRISLAGLREAHPHDVRITREAPNYRT
jgi:IMP dehydrogenase